MPLGRFAPSPTGDLHLGNLRTALVAWLFARSSASAFVLRIDDLDAATARAGCARRQLADLAAIGLDWDGPVVRQSERRAAHDEAIAALATAGLTYDCYCSRREIREAPAAPQGPDQVEGAYPGTCRHLTTAQRRQRERDGRRPALRLRAGGAVVNLVDRLCGPFAALVDDFVLRRGDGTPAYNLAVVVDDAHQHVGEVVRADDLLASTPRHVHLAGLLGHGVPAYAHVPLVVAPSGERLAKRHGAVTLAERAARGQPPATVVGLLAASVGLAAPGEPVTPADLVARFDVQALPTDPWVLDADDI
ncbi:MAG: tRNA glutamyl-Q(34) synthetase GluQRS [Acidimicrobiales bacterium]